MSSGIWIQQVELFNLETGLAEQKRRGITKPEQISRVIF